MPIRTHPSILNITFECLKTATEKIGDITQLRLMNSSGYRIQNIEVYKDIEYRNLIFKLVHNSIQLQSSIPYECVKKDSDLAKISESIAKQYALYCEEELKRLSLYNSKLSNEEIEQRKAYMEQLQRNISGKINFDIYTENDNLHSSNEWLVNKIFDFFTG